MSAEEIIKIWEEHEIIQVRFQFYCGGDSMGETMFHFDTDTDEKLPSKVVSELEGYFDDEVYRNVEFYEASDGHYMGESGTVYIELNQKEDGFYYMKSSESEWNESVDNDIIIKLSDEETKFIRDNVSNINGGYDDRTNFNYSRDFIITDKLEELIKNLSERIDDIMESYTPEHYEGELQEWYQFSTDFDNKDFINSDGELVIPISNNVTIFKEE
jgi:hypothetical protein